MLRSVSNVLLPFRDQKKPAIYDRKWTGVGDVNKAGNFRIVENTTEFNLLLIEFHVWKIDLNKNNTDRLLESPNPTSNLKTNFGE